MKWDKYTIDTTTEAEDFISMMLSENGIEGIEIEDNVPLTKEETGEMFIDFPPELPPDEGKSKVSFYLEAGEDHTETLKAVRIGLEQLRSMVEIGSGDITSSQTEDIDWINNWKQFFSSFYIDDILIKPTWEPLKEEDKNKFLIEIDPGISFGTGKHETTQLCIRQIRKYLKEGERVLDVGCGSGILSIAALKLGAGSVVGTDVDGDCITSTHENMTVNHLAEDLGEFYVGNLIDDKAFQNKIGTGYDLVVANILADIIIPMAPALYQCAKEQGVLITSGIIDFKENEVKEALKQAGFEILEVNHQGEWVNVTARKN
ncbi:50S ribosomal protein L11 methyltransferase [Thermoguttaceae bacterium LCP21S3_D4]|nr:50S ribosomal protein L11 methyltransferase [Lachnospiraceae bacterium]MDD6304757.1 50S ribosomal protein L11 methyltransferase [Lachnospiraceae bacterium]HCJ75606.1 50S ribosomal protein L11 methyltransferase [Roseburia sp.]